MYPKGAPVRFLSYKAHLDWKRAHDIIPIGHHGVSLANIIPYNQIKPRKGVYAVKAKLNNNFHNGIANFGKRPTVDGNNLLLEVHLLDFDQNIYGKELTVEFLTFIRDEKKFKNFTFLVNQIQKDIQLVKKYHTQKINGI